ncbi:MAG TPA: GNAT family N-acetyltransferase [Candidatus Paceibacterota bacterium]|nr:GNAT family N-acetyltransferase [Candidatus Paceibacterota bacterium]
MAPLKTATQQAVDELVALGRALHEDERTMTFEQLEALVEEKMIIVMTIVDNEHIVGMGTLYIIPKIGKTNGLVEDVIVDERYRGQGLGEKLTRAIIEEAKKRGLNSITLTSNSNRVAAHKLYEKVGFVKKETDVFKLSF